MNSGDITTDTMILIVTAVSMGTLTRLFTLKLDYRQYPSYPNGYFTHFVLGFIAAAIGAVAMPAIQSKNFTAITFLTIAIQQFRDVRRAERESLKSLENTEFTVRGDAYIDGIAKTFESRNYMVLTVSLLTGIIMQILEGQELYIRVIAGVIVGGITFIVLKRFTKGWTLGSVADVTIGKIKIVGSELFVDDIYVANTLGTENGRKLFLEQGIAAVITPKQEHFRITLDNFGQRQAILFEVCRALGVKRYHFTRKEYIEGKIIVALVPIIKDEDFLIKVIKDTPLLEDVTKSHKIMKTRLPH